MQSKEKRVMVGLSGGVDSAVCCRLLQKQNYHITALFLIMSDLHLNSLELAEKTAKELEVELIVKDMRNTFREEIILPFMQSYCNGTTPNPCVICNETVKFKTLLETADEYSCRYISTGHYARVIQKSGKYILKTAIDHKKDQSYMLYRLNNIALSRLLLPIGNCSKDEVREIAKKEGISSYNSQDSQEICFIEGESYSEYINRNSFYGKTGNFILGSEVLGRHDGVENYTIGQRKKLNVNVGKTVYVKRIFDTGDILLDFTNEEFINGIIVRNLSINEFFLLSNDDRYLCQVRYKGRYENVRIEEKDNSVIIFFEKIMKPPAPGQSAVLFQDDLVVGGGVITKVF